MKNVLRTASLLVVLALALSTLNCPSRQTSGSVKADITVADDGSGDYTTIKDAIDEAKDGDVILVKAGTYTEEIEIDGNSGSLTLIGEGPGRTILDADGEYAALTLKSDGCRISGFTLKGGESHGIYIPKGHQTVDHCLIIENGDRGIYLSTMYGGGSVELDHCTVADNKVSAIYDSNEGSNTRILNSILAFCGRSVVFDGDGNNITVRGSCLYTDDEDSDDPPKASRCIRKDPKFRNHENGDYHLKSNSPCIGAGTDGENMGCF